MGPGGTCPALPLKPAPLDPFVAKHMPADYDILHVQPVQLRFGEAGQVQSLQLRNNTKQRWAVKVKCSDTKTYRVNPVLFFVEPQQQAKLDVLRAACPAKVDKLVLVLALVSLGASTGRPVDVHEDV